MTFIDRALDASVLLSFDHTGYRRHARTFHPRDLAVSLAGKVVMVTGANSGLGFAASQRLAALGAKVWMACRDEARGLKAAAAIRAEQPDADVHFTRLDVSLISDIVRFAALFEGPLDVLVHNAGALTELRTETPEQHEVTFATNVLGPFVLTHLLLPKLRLRQGRVLTVASAGMYTQHLDLELMLGIASGFDGLVTYAQTKRAAVVLNELWAARELGVMFAAMHPGWVDTPSMRGSLPKLSKWMRPMLRTPQEGADTLVWLAACQRIAQVSGLFWFDRTIVPTQFLSAMRESPEERDALWRLLEREVAES